MLLNNAIGNRQAQTRALSFGFGGKKRIKQLVDIFLAYSTPGVLNPDFYAVAFLLCADTDNFK